MKKDSIKEMTKGKRVATVIFEKQSGGGNIGINKIFKKGDTLKVTQKQLEFLLKHKIAKENQDFKKK